MNNETLLLSQTVSMIEINKNSVTLRQTNSFFNLFQPNKVCSY